MPDPAPPEKHITFFGLTASPFQLKVEALANYCGSSWTRWPAQAPSAWAARRQYFGLQWAKRRGKVERYPQHDPLDEYPAVPFYRIGNGPWHYDSTGFADQLDALGYSGSRPLIPADPTLALVALLIEEAFDDFGLYMVHHMRWAGTERTTPMPQVTTAEMRLLVPRFFHKRLAANLEARQSRRCAYLFSVAPEGFDLGIAAEKTPAALPGFPETHSLLNQAWRDYLAAMESLLSQQPYLLGESFTVADASAYGQLSMNLIDGAPAKLLRELAPITYDWLCGIRDGAHCASDGPLYLSEHLQPLLKIIGETFIPLMQQNKAAYEQLVAQGETLFNEEAFDKGRSLYVGGLRGYPFRAVAKSFQVRAWRDLIKAWRQLSEAEVEQLRSYLPEGCTSAIMDAS